MTSSCSGVVADKASALRLTPVSRETESRLDRLVELLVIWQDRMNLVSASTLPKVWTRHIADSLQLLALAPPAAKRWVDLGSGAGFPGLVIASAILDRSGAVVHLVEKSPRKASFLREVAREARLPAEIHLGRIEEWAAEWVGPVDVVMARALAPLPRLLDLAAPLIAKGGVGLFPKGQDVDAELTEATKYWNVEFDSVPSITDPRGRILRVWRAQRIEKYKFF